MNATIGLQRPWRWWLALGALVWTAWACNPTPGTGRFDAAQLEIGGCDEDVMPWEPGFFTIDNFDDSVTTIRLQSVGGGIDRLDGIFIQVDRKFLLDNVGEEVPLGPPAARQNLADAGVEGIPLPLEGESEQGVVRAVVGFYQTCPEATDIPEPVGTIRFTRFEPEFEGQITGFITAPVVIDGRTGDAIGESFTGRFSFKVQKGRPYTNFTGPGNFDP